MKSVAHLAALVLIAATLVFLSPGTTRAVAPGPEALTARAAEDYEAGLYRRAAEGFAQAAQAGVVNGRLYYNAGNAWLKAGELGRAVLWYERAKRLLPNNPDLAYNLDYARARITDKQPPRPIGWRIADRLSGLVDVSLAIWAALGCNLLFWGVLFVRRTASPGFIHPRAAWSRPVMCIFLAGTLFFVCLSGAWYAERMFADRGVVLPEALAVRSGFGERATELFRLHAGSEVAVLRARDGHLLVRFGKDKMGWVPEDDVGRI